MAALLPGDAREAAARASWPSSTSAFGLTGRGNSEIAHQWLLMAIRNDYAPADARLEIVPDHDRPAQAGVAAVPGPARDARRAESVPRRSTPRPGRGIIRSRSESVDRLLKGTK